jgi:beta-lactamase regulating signal transducer with metallopeptidase domain
VSAPLVATPFALALLFKVTLVLALAGATAALLQARSAAMRGFVWLCALAGSLALLALVPLAPPLRVTVPSRITIVPALTPLPPTELVLDAAPPARAGDAAPLAGATPRRTAPRAAASLAALLAFAWLAGALLVLAWQLVARLALWRLEASAHPIDDAALDAETEALRLRLGIRGVVRLLAADVAGPLAWGWRRPVVLLPAGWREWPAERRSMVLTHELAHVARGDWAAQRLASLACALYWFHPLIWIAAARLRSESELACDDRVLAAGAPAPEYAQELLAFAREMHARRHGVTPAIGMARPTEIEGRLIAMLDERRSRSTLSTRTAALLLALVLLVLAPLAALSIQAVSAAPALARAEVLHGAEMDSHVQRTLPAHEGGRLTLDLPAGAALDIDGWDRDEVAVDARIDERVRRQTVFEIDPTSDGVTVRLRPAEEVSFYSSSHALQIHVPRRYDVHVGSSGGRIAIRGVTGRFDGHTGGGMIELEHLNGRANLQTGGGSIRATDCTLSGSLSTGGGHVQLVRVHGDIRAASGSEGVSERGGDADDRADHERMGRDEHTSRDRDDMDEKRDMGDHAEDGDLHDPDSRAHTQSASGERVRESKPGGAIELDEAPRGASLSTGGGDIHVGTAGGDVEARTGGGDIELGPVAGSVKATTGAGEVHVVVADARRRQDVQVWSGTGKVILELPRSLDAKLDLETAWTRSHGGPTHIASDFDVHQSQTNEWDSMHGTPRRYVRASGIMGNGAGHVEVHTVNGDIEVRRR